MRKGDVINGYTVLADPTTASAGQSRWTFAGRDGRAYFLKQFLFPKYPTADSPGSEETKTQKRAACAAFEAHQTALMRALRGVAAEGGNLIVALDFFRVGPTYYKVTERIDVASLSAAEIAKQALERRLLLMLTVSHSVLTLHTRGIVHGDLKPPNILLKVTREACTAKLIDFDNAFFAGSPPTNVEELVGDPAYYSPEVVRYVTGVASGSDLGVASDVFALGLVFYEYLTGRRPPLMKDQPYVGVAVERGLRIALAHKTVPRRVGELVESMLAREIAARPDVGDVFGFLKATRLEVVRRGGRADDTVESGTLRGLGRAKREPGPSVVSGAESGARLRGLEKFKGDRHS